MAQRQERARELEAPGGLLMVGLLLLFAHWFGGMLATEPPSPNDPLAGDTSVAAASTQDMGTEALMPFYRAMFHLLDNSLDRCQPLPKDNTWLLRGEFETTIDHEKRIREWEEHCRTQLISYYEQRSQEGIIWSQSTTLPRFAADQGYYVLYDRLVCGSDGAIPTAYILPTPPALYWITPRDVIAHPFGEDSRSGVSLSLYLRTSIERARELRAIADASRLHLRYTATLTPAGWPPMGYRDPQGRPHFFELAGSLRVQVIRVELIAKERVLYVWQEL